MIIKSLHLFRNTNDTQSGHQELKAAMFPGLYSLPLRCHSAGSWGKPLFYCCCRLFGVLILIAVLVFVVVDAVVISKKPYNLVSLSGVLLCLLLVLITSHNPARVSTVTILVYPHKQKGSSSW